MFFVFRDLLKDLESEVADRAFSLCQGTPVSFDEYKRSVGEIQGLNIAIERLNEALKKADDDDD